MIINISVIGDEVAITLAEQIRILKSLGNLTIEIRKINNVNIVECSENMINEAESLLKNEKMIVSSISTNIGKQLKSMGAVYYNFFKALNIAEKLDCKFVRIFSNLSSDRQSNIECILEFIEIAKRKNITVILENEVNTIADSPQRCTELINKTNGQLNLLYDPGNFYREGFNIEKAYKELEDKIIYIHLKDMKKQSFSWEYIGDGDMNIISFLDILKTRNFIGYISLEPHFCIDDYSERENTFIEYYKRFKNLLNEMGV